MWRSWPRGTPLWAATTPSGQTRLNGCVAIRLECSFHCSKAVRRCKASLQILGDLEVLVRADSFVGSYHSKRAR